MREFKAQRKTNRIAGRARVIYFVITILVTVIILGIGQVISRDIADDNAMRMSRQYAIEAAANFQIFMNPHMRIMQQMSYSTAIARWLANENDAEAKTAAFEAMMGHAATLPYARYMFTIEESMRSYDFSMDITPDEFIARGVLDRYGAESQWYFDARYAELPFVLRIQRNQINADGSYALYIWSNRRVYYEGRFVGIFTLGSPFSAVSEATFGGFYDGYKRGYVIDNYGMVRLDSTGYYELTANGLPVFPSVPEAADNPDLAYEITSHLQGLQRGEFPLGTPSREAIRLVAGAYRYAGISPIVGTNWSVVVLSEPPTVFDMRYTPLVFIAVALIIIAMFAGGLLIQRIAIDPIFNLTESVTTVETYSDMNLYGVERDDEIGVLAQTIKRMLSVIELNREKERIAEIEQRTSMVIETAPVAVVLLDKNMNPVDCNELSVKMWGFTDKDEFLRVGYSINPPSQPDGKDSEEVLRYNFSKALDEGFSHIPEFMCKKLDGTLFFAETSYTRVRYKDDFAIIEYTRDITQEKQTDELRKLMYDSVSIPSTLWDENGKLIDCNRAMTDFFGLSSKEETIKRYYEFTPEFQACGRSTEVICKEELAEIFATGQTVRKRWLHKLGEEIVPVEVTMTRVPTGDKFVCVCYAVDLRPIEAAMAKEREAHEQAQLMLDNAPISMTLFDKNLKTITCNREAYEMYGVPYKLEYEQMEATMPPTQPDGRDSMEVFREGTQKAFHSGFYRTEFMCKKIDGTLMPTEITWASVIYKGDTVVVEYAVDLTERKAAEEKMLTAYKKIQEILDLSPTIINEWSRDIQIVKTNKQAVEWYRVSNEQEYLDRFAELAPEYQPCGTPTWQKAQELVTEAFEKGSVTFEWITNTADGEPLPIWVKLVRSSDAEDAIVYAFTSDLREIKKLEAQLRDKELDELERENREYITALFQASPMFIDVWDEDFNLIDCNDKVCDLLGVPTKEEFLDNLAEKYNPYYQPCGTPSVELYMQKFKKGLEEGYVKYDWVHLDVNGNEVPLEVTYVRIYRQGKALMVGYNYDLRDIKKAEAERQLIEVAEESNRAKSAFLARMSHEIRTPISAVMGISEIELQNSNISARTEEAFNKIYSSANLLLGIVNDILDLSKIEAEKMELARVKYEVASLVVDTASIHIGFASSKNIRYNVSVDENLPTHLIGDALRIAQVISNVLSNAFKYTMEGSVDLSFKCADNEEDDDFITLQITVKDTGLGMTTEQLADLKNEYTRYHERNYQFIEGTGLGMPIVYNLIKLMDARIEIDSEVGIGTNVVVNIPQQRAVADILGREIAQNLEQFKETAVMKKFSFTPEAMPYGSVLVVDDVDANLYVARGLLSFYELRIETCNNGTDAIEKVRKGKVYDIIFMDYMMPGLNGTEAMHKIRDMGYTNPIVALTANAMIGIAEEFIEDGFDGFISKPIQTKQLNAILIKHIRDKQSAEVLRSVKSISTDMPTANMDIDNYLNDPVLLAKLSADFARNHKDTFSNMCRAINTGDIATAHRLAHTIKGSAGIIYEDTLMKAANDVEMTLAKKEKPTSAQLSAFKEALIAVLDKIGDIETTQAYDGEALGKDEALALLDRVSPLLSLHDIECIDFIGELRKISGSDELCREIEDFNFRNAMRILDEIRLRLLD